MTLEDVDKGAAYRPGQQGVLHWEWKCKGSQQGRNHRFTAAEMHCMYVCVCVSVCVCVCGQSCMTLWDPKDCNPPSSSVRGIFQARILEWVAISFSRGSYRTTDRTRVSCVSSIGRWVLYPCTTWEALNTIIYLFYDSHLQIHHFKKFLDYGDGIYSTLHM